ncbi:MAG: hypothetical protein IJM92_14595 [Fibrobacter sp.]|uniref:hypothetical protein n=1 Tax=Fibrobacter sp. TaxID=35828 RepID=UPI0025C12C08|nr:hypothetical protein [Fibrobacter sp.]MBQ7080848.1 hypothetical protein [Fibrobacter sp.]
MSEGEKIQFNGNQTLLRVCVIVFIVNLLNLVINMAVMAGRGGFFSSLWSALTTSSFEDLLGMGGLLIASGVFIPFVLGVLAVAVLFALGVFAFVKKNVKVLKILAVLFLIWAVLGAFAISSINALTENEIRQVNIAQNLINLIFNVNIVVAVAAFFVASKKHDESGAAAAEEPFNLGLFRLCAVCFIVSGLNSLTHFVFMQPPVFQLAFFGVVNLAVGVFALAKKNVVALMVGSLMMLFQILLNVMYFVRVPEMDSYVAFTFIFHTLFNTSTVIGAAVFFIKPEWVKSCLQKMKG